MELQVFAEKTVSRADFLKLTLNIISVESKSKDPEWNLPRQERLDFVTQELQRFHHDTLSSTDPTSVPKLHKHATDYKYLSSYNRESWGADSYLVEHGHVDPDKLYQLRGLARRRIEIYRTKSAKAVQDNTDLPVLPVLSPAIATEHAYNIILRAHFDVATGAHCGRDITFGKVSAVTSCITKDMVGAYCEMCPGCRPRRKNAQLGHLKRQGGFNPTFVRSRDSLNGNGCSTSGTSLPTDEDMNSIYPSDYHKNNLILFARMQVDYDTPTFVQQEMQPTALVGPQRPQQEIQPIVLTDSQSPQQESFQYQELNFAPLIDFLNEVSTPLAPDLAPIVPTQNFSPIFQAPLDPHQSYAVDLEDNTAYNAAYSGIMLNDPVLTLPYIESMDGQQPSQYGIDHLAVLDPSGGIPAANEVVTATAENPPQSNITAEATTISLQDSSSESEEVSSGSEEVLGGHTPENELDENWMDIYMASKLNYLGKGYFGLYKM